MQKKILTPSKKGDRDILIKELTWGKNNTRKERRRCT
jgi:hypothetical protein